MKLWGGRFTKETDKLVNDFNASIGFDKRLYKQDIEGSIAHATMLGDCNIIPKEDSELIVSELKNILADIEAGKLVIDDEYEDIHTFVEATLITRIGDVGKKLHTGRSRNDQVALDMRLYTRSMIEHTNILLKELLEAILKVMKENIDTFMPGFTHLQKAQPITLAHHLGAYFEMFVRDRSRLEDNYKRMNYCPLGAGALAGTTYPLDRDQTAKLLGFEGPTRNSLDSVSDRDYLIEYLSDLSIIMMHLSRLSEEICIWNSNEYGFTETHSDAGYSLLKKEVIVKVKETKADITPTEANITGIQSKSDADSTANDGVPNGSVLKNDVTVQTTAASATVDETKATMTKHDDSGNAYINMQITNQKQFMLPMTGGAGNYLLIIAGVVVAGCGILILNKNRGRSQR